MLYTTVPVILMLIGALTYAYAPGKLPELGRITFGVGLFFAALVLVHEHVSLP